MSSPFHDRGFGENLASDLSEDLCQPTVSSVEDVRHTLVFPIRQGLQSRMQVMDRTTILSRGTGIFACLPVRQRPRRRLK